MGVVMVLGCCGEKAWRFGDSSVQIVINQGFFYKQRGGKIVLDFNKKLNLVARSKSKEQSESRF